jgi:CDP-glucose 4,6-dehydratase
MDVISSKLSGKKVLVTGHTGFKGSWLSVFLKILGAEVYGISLPVPDSRLLYKDAEISQYFEKEFFIDIRETTKIIPAINEIAPDYTFHLAAQSLVIDSYTKPIETFDVNIMGTINVLNQVLELNKSQGICIATTDKVYKNIDYGRTFNENDELGNLDPYSASKAAVELVVASMVSTLNTNSIPVSTVRAGNVIGGGDWSANRLIPDIVRSIENGNQLFIRYPKATRPWQYVLDCLWGYILVAEMHLTQSYSQKMSSFNFGPKHSLNVMNLIEIFENAWGKEKIKTSFAKEKFEEKSSLALDVSKAFEILGWAAMLNPEAAIRKTAQSYKNIVDGKNVNHLMESDIKEYLTDLTEFTLKYKNVDLL